MKHHEVSDKRSYNTNSTNLDWTRWNWKPLHQVQHLNNEFLFLWRNNWAMDDSLLLVSRFMFMRKSLYHLKFSIKCSLCLPCSCEVIYNFSSLPSRYFPIPFWDFPCNLHVRRVASYKDFSCINLPNVGWEECLLYRQLCCEFPSPNSLSIFYTCKTLWIQFLCRLYVWDEKHVCCNFTALERGLSVFDCSSACSMPVWNSGFCLKLWILLWLG